ncbi:hypothetical protein IB238_09235 [Rhizobium sp. ARZ01]|uniref:hypothetical protein n=1 Tax=Rhizobium sp. ARZ01 TaxID=2769313 RepID=UPI00177F5C53|nr:hypothetical protein [Rhizobium sp. ARZ01]MBD9372801.1 hypothetical protein [Rhizobium sp. ARZ01]
MDIAAAVQRIRAAAMAKPASQRARYVFDNIEHQQRLARKFVESRVKPSTWSLSAHEELIRGLIAMESEFRAERVAA